MDNKVGYERVLEAFKVRLLESGIAEEQTAFILGRILRKIVDEVAQRIQEVIGEDTLDSLAKQKEIKQQAEIERLFQEKTGQSLASYRIQVADKLLAEYEAA